MRMMLLVFIYLGKDIVTYLFEKKNPKLVDYQIFSFIA